MQEIPPRGSLKHVSISPQACVYSIYSDMFIVTSCHELAYTLTLFLKRYYLG